MLAGVFLDLKVRRVLPHVFEANYRIEFQDITRRIEIDQGLAVAEHVVDPPDLGRLWPHCKLAVEQALIEAVTRSEEELVAPQFDRPMVAIDGAVVDGVDGNRSRSGPAQYGPFSPIVPLPQVNPNCLLFRHLPRGLGGNATKLRRL